MQKLRIVTFGMSGGEMAHASRFTTPADLPPHEFSPYSHVHVRRESLGIVHRSRAIIFCRPVPNLVFRFATFHRCVGVQRICHCWVVGGCGATESGVYGWNSQAKYWRKEHEKNKQQRKSKNPKGESGEEAEEEVEEEGGEEDNRPAVSQS
jgi:hypothetical protein